MNKLQKALLTLTIVFSGFAAKDGLLAQQSDKGADNNKRDMTEEAINKVSTTPNFQVDTLWAPISNDPSYTNAFNELKKKHDDAIKKIEAAYTERQETLEGRKKASTEQIDKEFGELVGMVSAGDAVDIDPEARENIYDQVRQNLRDREGKATGNLYYGSVYNVVEKNTDIGKTKAEFLQGKSVLDALQKDKEPLPQQVPKAPGQ